MVVETRALDVKTRDATPLRVTVAQPKDGGPYPGLLLFSDIFQMTGPTLRTVLRFAGYGFVVYAPDLYRRIEMPGRAIAFEAERKRALDDAERTTVAEFDADRRIALDALARDPRVAPGRIGATGFCIGGHLALRAALEPEVRATVAFYPTGVHDGALGGSRNVDTLARGGEIRGDVLLVFGDVDPHVPPAGRATIDAGLRGANVRARISTYPGDHAFMRDEGPRYDPESTDRAFDEAVTFLREHLREAR